MPATYKSNIDRVKNKSDVNKMIILRRVMEDARNYSNPKTPMETSNLRASLTRTFVGDKGIMEWHEPYSEVQEKGYRMTKDGKKIQFRNYTTPGTSPHYAEEGVQRAVKESYKYFGGWLQ